MAKYQCGPCGYIYDPAEGDPDGGIGTAFGRSRFLSEVLYKRGAVLYNY